jgi:phosphoribosylaminoimidazole-succinocarboxamide synthase
VRGYLAGSAYKEYERSGTVHGMPCPPGSVHGRPAARAHLHPVDQGHRGPRPQHLLRRGRRPGGEGAAEQARDICLEAYRGRRPAAEQHGHHLADTKFELGYIDGVLSLCDEVLTPDSSRFWPADQWFRAPTRRPSTSSPCATGCYVTAYERISGRALADWYGADR